MARPAKNYCDYFPHMRDMRNHKKIKAVRNKFGITGYAIWSLFLEYLTGNDGNEFEYSETELELMSGDFGVSVTELTDVLNYCLKLELLFLKNGFVHSPSLDEYLLPVYDKRQVAKKLSQQQLRKNGQYCKNNTDSTVVSVTEMPQTKLNGIKGNEIEVNKPLPPAAENEFSETQNIAYKLFNDWIVKYTPSVNKLPKPITIKEFLILRGEIPNSKNEIIKISKSECQTILESIENNKDYLKKYRSPYLCILHWHKNNLKK